MPLLHRIAVIATLAGRAGSPAGPAGRCLSGGTFPEALSATGCYRDLARQIVAPGLIPYDVASPLWTDGEGKRRFFSLPDRGKLGLAADGRIVFPVGTVILKEFRSPPSEAAAGVERPTETRFMWHAEEGWQFRTYVWNATGTEATLYGGERGKDLLVEAPGGTQRRHYVPGANECSFCHASAGGAEVLGPTVAQLSRPAPDNRTALDRFRALGLLDSPIPPAALASGPMADPRDEKASLEARARAWLHANCAHCHRPGGWMPPTLTLDLRWETPFSATHTCRESTQYLEVASRIEPGHAETSALWRRIRTRGDTRMPPLGVSQTDPAAAVVREWIASLRDCPSSRAGTAPATR